jgi:hypothetical protein
MPIMSLQKVVYQSSRKSLPIRTFFHRLAFRLELLLLAGYRKDDEIIDLIRRVWKESDLSVTAGEAFLVHSLAQRQRGVPGEMAEVGVYRGGTAKLICEAKGDGALHLFDTFAGLPSPDLEDEGFFTEGWYAGRLERVEAYLAAYENVHFYAGEFSETAMEVDGTRFSFVHLDVDLYRSMKEALAFFYPRLARGGVILGHDYQLPGVRSAVEETFDAMEGRVVELANSQFLVWACDGDQRENAG